MNNKDYDYKAITNDVGIIIQSYNDDFTINYKFDYPYHNYRQEDKKMHKAKIYGEKTEQYINTKYGRCKLY